MTLISGVVTAEPTGSMTDESAVEYGKDVTSSNREVKNEI
jgi:hypothetical protein